MKQPQPTAKKPLDILSAPDCEVCGRGTRFVGLEADPVDNHADLSTYECLTCQHVQVAKVTRTNGYDRTAKS